MQDLIPDEITSVAAALATARGQVEPYIPPTTKLGGFDTRGAYRIQHAYVAQLAASDGIAGYKSALTAAAMQRANGLSEPITGVLMSSGARGAGASIASSDYRMLLLETELAFRLKTPVTSPISDVSQLRAVVGGCAPAIELADPGFGATKFRGEDLIATNSASAGWIEGETREVDDLDLNAQTVRFYRDDELLHEAESRVVLDDQWQALLWLINQTIAQGYEIAPSHLLLTGAIGGAHPGKPGHYRAQFGDLGELSFRVQ